VEIPVEVVMQRRRVRQDEASYLDGLPGAVRSLIEARTGDGVFVVAPDYTVVYWDRQAEHLTGCSEEVVVGSPCHEAMLGEREDGEPICGLGCPVMRLAQVGRPVTDHDMRVATSSGGKRWVNVSILSVDSEDGPYLVHLLRDVQKTHETLEMARGIIRLTSGDSEGPEGRAAEPRISGNHREPPELTPRQFEVLRLLSRGRNAAEIGRDLFLSEKTVRNHISALLRALGAHSQLEALARAREIGLISG